MKIFQIITLIIGLIVVLPVNASTEISRQSELHPLTITYDDLSTLLENLKGQLSKANIGFQKDEHENITLSISKDEDTVTINGWERITEIKGLPNPGRSLRFRYHSYSAPVSDVELTFTDYSRTITVTGSDGAEVNGVYAYLKDNLGRQVNIFGGTLPRYFGGILLLLLGLISILYGNRIDKNGTIYKLLGLAIITSLILLPWSEWLPGFAIYLGSASFVDRYVNTISLLGLISSFAIPALGYLFTRKRSQRKAHSNSLKNDDSHVN